MERLTFKKRFEHFKPDEETTTVLANGYVEIVEQNEFNPKKSNYFIVGKAIDKLAEYEDLDEQGLLLRLPCKIGDTIFVVPSKANFDLNILHRNEEFNRVYKQIVHSVRLYDNNSYLLTTCDGLESVVSQMFKETWFLTEDEAKEQLRYLESITPMKRKERKTHEI